MDFELGPGAYQFRGLKLTTGRMQGWDVFALQTGLAGTPGFEELRADGIFGKRTDAAVQAFQEACALDKDGIAGMATQTTLARLLAKQFRRGWDLPGGIPYGHIESESGCQLGNHTAPYGNGSRDCGVVQRNTRYATIQEAFDSAASLMRICDTIVTKWSEYEQLGKVSRERALALACGSWNAPAWTDTLARGGALTAAQSAWIEGYILRVTVYVNWENV